MGEIRRAVGWLCVKTRARLPNGRFSFCCLETKVEGVITLKKRPSRQGAQLFHGNWRSLKNQESNWEHVLPLGKFAPEPGAGGAAVLVVPPLLGGPPHQGGGGGHQAPEDSAAEASERRMRVRWVWGQGGGLGGTEVGWGWGAVFRAKQVSVQRSGGGGVFWLVAICNWCEVAGSGTLEED